MPKMTAAKLIALSKNSAKKRDLPASLIYAMIRAESTGDPAAASNRGALGLMQLKGDAAKEMGYEHEEMTDPDKAVDAGSGYVAKMLRRFQDPGRALSAYNAGPGKTRQSDDLAPGTSGYVSGIASNVKELTQPGAPFEDEVNVGSLPMPMQTMKKQKIQTYIDELLQRVPQAPPLLAAGGPPTFDAQGISDMLTLKNFAQ
jgi:hypothetical protein